MNATFALLSPDDRIRQLFVLRSGGYDAAVLEQQRMFRPGGITTLHANSAAAALVRLEQLVQEAVVTVPHALIAEAVDILVFIRGRGAERRIESLLELAGLDEDDDYILKPMAAPVLRPVAS